MKILHIEDNVAIIDVFRKVLSKKGHDYFSASDSKGGLDLILKNHYDLVFLDLAMPGLSGFELLDEYSKPSSKGSADSIIVITATNLSASESTELFNKGVRKIMTKPVGLKELLDIVNQLEITVG